MLKEPLVIIYESRLDYLNLYCLNLQVYVSAKFVICNRFDELVDMIKKENPDLIFISLVSEDKVLEKIQKINNAVKDKFSKPICYIQIKSKKNIVKDDYKELTISDIDVSVKDIVSTVAKKMKITAKYMSELNVGEYYPINLKYILPGWQATQPFYTKQQDGTFKVILAKGQYFKKELIDTLGLTTNVYCKSDFRLEVINSFTSSIKSILEQENLEVGERYEQTEIAFNMISQSVATIGLPETTLNLAKSTIRSMEKLITQIPSLSKLYRMFLEENTSMRFKHSMLASYMGQYVLKDQSWNNHSITQQWSYLCFFHDIILDQDSYLLFEYDDDVKKSQLTEKEKSIVLNHAQMASKMISQMKEIPIGIDVLIKQHHGSKMGNSLSEISMTISPLCIIFILIENYVHFFLSNNESVKKPEEIATFIDSLFKKYPYPNYKKMIPLLRTIPIRD